MTAVSIKRLSKFPFSTRGSKFFNDLTLFENIRITVQAAQGHGLEMLSSTRSLEEVDRKTLDIVEAIGLRGKENYLARNLSYGDRRVLEIGMALASRPKLLLLDEPTAGMSSEETREAVKLIQRVTEGKTLIIVEHDMEVVFSNRRKNIGAPSGKTDCARFPRGNPEDP
jgi:branched-chain amino acid transport system ATP-binding protein